MGSLILMILSSPLNKNETLPYCPFLQFCYLITLPTLAAPLLFLNQILLTKNHFLISYSFFEIIYRLLHLNYSHCEEILQSPYSLFLFILKKGNKKNQTK